MKRGYARVDDAYERLRTRSAPEGGALRVLVGPSGRQDDAIVVKDYTGQYGLFVQLPEGRERFDVPLGRTLQAIWLETDGSEGTSTRLSVVCTDARLLRSFLSLVGEMLDRSDESGRRCIDELSEVLESWRAALAREKAVMERSRAIGLFGELTVLERLAQRDPRSALAAWSGRDGHRHDFSRSNALEVKSFTGTGSPVVTIHGVRQLDPPGTGTLHLVAFRVLETQRGASLSEMLDRIAAHGIPRQDIARTLGDDAPGAEQLERRFEIEETRLHLVGDDFPGIRASRLDGTALRGVESLTYDLQLDACPGSLDPESLDRVLEEL